MTLQALWIPFEVDDLDVALAYYTDHFGLSVVDRWERDGERGVVLRVAEGAFIELVSPPTGPVPRLAFEYTEESEVDSAHAGFGGGAEAPHRFPRGHYGFTAPGPAGANVLVWSEK